MEESGEDNSGGNADTFKEVLFSHLRRITNVATVEMRGGYYTIMVTKAGGEKIFMFLIQEKYIVMEFFVLHIFLSISLIKR